MGKIIKTLLLGVVAIVALVIIAVLVVALTFDPNEYKDEITASVEEATGRSFEIDGEIGLTVFPVLSLEFGAIRLGNAEGFDASESFVALDSASASVRVLPALLSREIRMGTVSVQGLAINLAVDAAGTTNWDDLATAGETPAADSGAAPRAAATALLASRSVVSISPTRRWCSLMRRPAARSACRI